MKSVFISEISETIGILVKSSFCWLFASLVINIASVPHDGAEFHDRSNH